MKSQNILLSFAVASLALAAPAVNAAGVITNGAYTVGIGDNGELYDFGTGVGFQRLADGYDPLAPGTPRDSWGIATNLGSAYGDQSDFGAVGLTGTVFTGLGGAAATSTTTTNVGVTVHQAYSFVAPNIVKITHTITIDPGADVTGFIFQRDWDVDVDPTAFNENTFGHIGAAPQVIESSGYGFENPDPTIGYATNCTTGFCNIQGDLGGGIKIDDSSWTFAYYYGINQNGQDVNMLIAQAQALGISYLVPTQSSENGLWPNLGYNSAFIAVGYVPEPASWAMMIAGFGLIGGAMRRRVSALTA
jgi:hypothetical protein